LPITWLISTVKKSTEKNETPSKVKIIVRQKVRINICLGQDYVELNRMTLGLAFYYQQQAESLT
jgi:hypothetical protein